MGTPEKKEHGLIQSGHWSKMSETPLG